MRSLAPFAALAILTSALALAATTGPARAIDGDTIEVAGKRIFFTGSTRQNVAKFATTATARRLNAASWRR